MKFNTISEILNDIKQGKMVIMVDDEDRENEGDLVMAASCADHEHINFMVKHGRGIVCVPMEEERLSSIGIQPMQKDQTNKDHFSTIKRV